MKIRFVGLLVPPLAAVLLLTAAAARAGEDAGGSTRRIPYAAAGNATGGEAPEDLPWKIPGVTAPPREPGIGASAETAPDRSSRGTDAGRFPESTAGNGEDGDFREPDFGHEPPPAAVSDPIEPVNRGIFFLNDKLYRWLFKPVAQVYKEVVPEGTRIAVRNVFFNLGTPIRAGNALLQGDLEATGTELLRLVINSTLGVGGLVDAAAPFHLERKNTDTGLTLGTYGLGHGFYIVLPILGPSSARDTVGVVGDTFLDPLTYLLTPGYAIGARFARSTTDLSFRIGEYEQLTGAAVDPYIAVREAYIQNRAKRLMK